MSSNLEGLSQRWLIIQGTLFPWLKEALGELTKKQQMLVTTLEVIRLEQYLSDYPGFVGRPLSDRVAIASAFTAKAVYNMGTTRLLLDRLATDIGLRRTCGWEHTRDIPSEATFSRAFAEFSKSQLPELIHQTLVKEHLGHRVVGHLSRDSTAIHAREKPEAKLKDDEDKPPKKRGRPKKGEERPKVKTRLQRQAAGMTLDEMLDDLPKPCNVLAPRKIARDIRKAGPAISFILTVLMVAFLLAVYSARLLCMILKSPFHWHRAVPHG